MGCSTDGEKSVANYLIKPGVPMTEEICKNVACLNNPDCDYYFYTSGKCYCGDLDGTNPVPASELAGNVDVYLKDPSKAANEAFKSCGTTPKEMKKVMIMVQNDQKVGLADATIKVDSAEEATKTGADGKMTLAKEYEIGATLSIEASRTGFVAKLDFKVEDNSGEDNLVTIELGYKKLETCPTDGDKSVANYLIKAGVPMAEDICRNFACASQSDCDYYFYTSGKCYCGDLDGANPVPAPELTGNVDVYLKDPSKADNEAFKSCGITQKEMRKVM